MTKSELNKMEAWADELQGMSERHGRRAHFPVTISGKTAALFSEALNGYVHNERGHQVYEDSED